MKFYYQSLDDATVTYSGTEDTGYPVTNLQDRNEHTLFKDTNISSCEITIDLKSARAIDYLYIGGLTGSGAAANQQIALQWSTNGTIWADVFSWETFTNGDYLKSFTSVNYRFYKILLKDSALGGAFDVQAETVFLGTAIELSRNPNLDETEDFEYSSQVTEALGGGRFGFGDHDNLRQKWNYNFDYITETDKTNMKAMAAGVYGSRRPFYFTDPAGTTHFARMMDNLTITQIGYQAYTMSLALEQEI